MRGSGHYATRLPKHPAALRALVLQSRRERDDALAQNERLAALLTKLQRMQFGRTSERLPEDQWTCPGFVPLL